MGLFTKDEPPKGSYTESQMTEFRAQISNKLGVPDMGVLMNGALAEACGYFNFGTAGFPQNQGNPWTEPVSDTTSLFKNLRWYFVSNFRQLLSEMYVEIGLVSTIIDVPVDDALRGGVTLKSKELDEDDILELQNSLDRDADLLTVGQGAKWNRLFGGAGIIVLTDQDPEEPFDLSAIGPDSKLEFRAADLWELFWTTQNTEGYDPSIQVEEFEYYSYYAMKLHKSRVMRLKGQEAPSFVRPRLRGWGTSEVERLVRSLNQYYKAVDLGYEVLDEFKIDVYKIKNLTDALMSPQGKQKIQQRIQLANWQKNYQNALVMDSEDDWDHKQLSFAGLDTAMQGIRMQVASDMRMPMLKLFGTPATGLNASDENSIEVYNSMVESQVRNKVKYDILRICEIKCQKLFGFVPADLSLEFQPLKLLSAEQQENVKTQKFNRLFQAMSINKITDFEFREALNKGNLLDITLDNSGDSLNPEDLQAGNMVEEEGQSQKSPSKDIDDPGANRQDTRQVRAWDKNGAPKGNVSKTPGDDNVHVQNSDAYDKASYEADGGDRIYSPERLKLIESLTHANPGLWKQCEQESRNVYGGTGSLGFTTFLYVKRGGKI